MAMYRNLRTDILIKAIEDEGLPIDDYKNLENYINHAIKDDRFKFIEKDGKSIGFVIWELLWIPEGLDIYVSYLVILKQYKGIYNLKELTTFWKKKYDGVHKFRWHNNKSDEDKEFLQQKELTHV